MKAALQGLVVGLSIVVLAGCGGSGTTTGMSSPSTSTTGTMVKTSASTISVNGKTFDVSRATIRVNKSVATAADLRSGMRVKVKAKSSGSGNDASEVDSDAEVRGAVTAVDAGPPQSFTIGTTKVLVDANTVYDDLTPASLAAILVGVEVEVDGTRNAAGDIVATRVEGKGAAAGAGTETEDDELRGTVAAVDASSITVGTQVVTVTATTVFAPTTCSLSSIKPGSTIEAHGSFGAAGAFTATRIECEDQGVHDGADASGGENDVEGLVSSVDKTAGTFTVDTQAVRYTDATRFEDGTVDSLVADARVEVRGTLDGTTLVATEIEFKAQP